MLFPRFLSDEQRMALEQGRVAPGYLHPVKVAINDVVIPGLGGRPSLRMVDLAARHAKSMRWWLQG